MKKILTLVTAAVFAAATFASPALAGVDGEIYDSVLLKRGLSPVSVADNTAQTTQIIDMQGYDAAYLGILIGSVADADATFTVLVEESTASNMSGATEVADVNLTGTEAAAGFQFDDDNEVRKLLIRPTKRYIQVTITPANNASAAVIAAFFQLIGSNYLPVTQSAS